MCFVSFTVNASSFNVVCGAGPSNDGGLQQQSSSLPTESSHDALEAVDGNYSVGYHMIIPG